MDKKTADLIAKKMVFIAGNVVHVALLDHGIGYGGDVQREEYASRVHKLEKEVAALLAGK